MSNISGTVSDGVKSSLDSAFSNVTSMLEGNKVSWKSWGISVLQILEKVALQMAVVNALGGSSSSSSGGLLGTIAGGIAGYFTGGSGGAEHVSSGTALQEYASNLSLTPSAACTTHRHLAHTAMVFTAPRKHSHLPKAREFSEKQDQKPLCR